MVKNDRFPQCSRVFLFKIGRKEELKLFKELMNSNRSEFVAVYGRRRVGKTFLIREAFNYQFTFQHTGLLDAPLTEQLVEFRESLYSAGMKQTALPKTWSEAFHALERFLQQLPEGRTVISSAHSWSFKPADGHGVQIDLLIDRNDDCINLFEMKYSAAKYRLDEQEYERLQYCRETFIAESGTSKAVQLTMVTPFGLVPGGDADDIQCNVTMDEMPSA